MNNRLKITEPDLLAFHNKVCSFFDSNKIEFSAEYHEEKTKEYNSAVLYYIKGNPIRSGLICSNKGKFSGVVTNIEKIQELEKKGVDFEVICTKEPVFARASCVMSFVGMLLIDRLESLKFEDDLIKEFDREVETNKNKEKKGKAE